MDPQACLERIFQAVRDNDKDEFEGAMEDLAQWFIKSGHPPVLKSLHEHLGPSRRAVHSEYIQKWEPCCRKALSSRRCTISVVDPNNETGNGPYAFTIWTYSGEEWLKVLLPME